MGVSDLERLKVRNQRGANVFISYSVQRNPFDNDIGGFVVLVNDGEHHSL
jgi:MbtH-like protein